MALCAATALAYDFSAVAPSGQTLYYNIVDGHAEVVRSTSSSYVTGDLVIPSTVTYNDVSYTVTSIGSEAFYGCTGLTSVTIGSGVTSIGNEAFRDCSGLTSVTIPDGVTSIGNSAFSGCSSLTSVTIPDGVTTIGDFAFYGCTGLTSVTIPDGVTSIGNNAFYNVRHIEYYGSATGSPWGAFSMNGVTDGDFVFSDTTKHYLLTYSGAGGEVAIPSTVDTIGRGAFYRCSGLTSVTIPDGVTSIGSEAFYGCTGLTSVNIPDGVTSIGNEAFRDCSGLTSVTIGSGVTSIGNRAFSGCSGLTSVTIGSGVTSIGNSAFYDCSGLTSVAFNADSCTSAGSSSYSYRAFSNCPNITNFTFGNNVKVIPAYLCYGLSGLTSVTIPDSVTSIGNRAFYGCSGLTSVTIPDGVTSIGSNAFYNVRHIEYHGSATGSPWGAISMNGVTDGDFVFSDTTKHYLLTYSGAGGEVAIPSTVDTIGRGAFSGCRGLTSVTIPDGVTSIGDYAFYNCSGLTSVTISSGVTSIGNYAFGYCSGLTSVTIGSGVTSIGSGAFEYCSGLTSVTIGSGVTSIGSGAFGYCNGLTSVIIPDGVTSISDAAFYACSGLTSVTIGSGVTSIGSYAFSDCSGLTSVIIGSAVTSIGSGAFYGCSGLTSVTIGSGVTSIGIEAFYGCSGLTEITSRAAFAPMLGYAAMTGVPSTITINIPCGSQLNYSSRWSCFSNFIETTGFSINASSADTTMGTVSILAQPTCSSPAAEVNAVPNDGFRFNHWSDGNSDNPRSLTLTSDTAITAYFVAVIITNDGIADVETLNAKVYSSQGQIVVEGADGNTVWLYDVNGRVLATKHDEYTPLRFDVSVSGSYMIKIGNHAARKVVVLR